MEYEVNKEQIENEAILFNNASGFNLMAKVTKKNI